jgi:hypothetical protein
MGFVMELRQMIEWIDGEAAHLSKADVLDGARTRALSVLQKFVAYPHCNNFSLMMEGSQ